jgi:hypothetical protein
MGEASYPCPCCGYLTFTGPPGGFEGCPICFWEDDGTQLRWPRLEGGANTVSLAQAQKIFMECGASQRRFQPHVRAPNPSDRRDESFRPVSSEDSFEDVWSTEPWPDDRTRLYWWRPTYWRSKVSKS